MVKRQIPALKIKLFATDATTYFEPDFLAKLQCNNSFCSIRIQYNW